MPPTKKKARRIRSDSQLPAVKRSVAKADDKQIPARCKPLLQKIARSISRADVCVSECENNVERGESGFLWLNLSSLLLNLTDLKHQRRQVRKLLPQAKKPFSLKEGA